MAFELRDGQGSLFRNERATTDRHPTHTGSCMIGGVEYRISAWTKEGKKGRFFSLAIEPKDTDFGAGRDAASAPRTAQETQEGTRQAQAGQVHHYDDPIPF